jgi:predicted metalloenzyme YecM
VSPWIFPVIGFPWPENSNFGHQLWA